MKTFFSFIIISCIVCGIYCSYFGNEAKLDNAKEKAATTLYDDLDELKSDCVGKTIITESSVKHVDGLRVYVICCKDKLGITRKCLVEQEFHEGDTL